ncbi:MAG: DNA integrity scanning protein DisA nucleotide-binding domain protein [Bacilli bacterium]|nr:DNA integrity scanning protein DisA nucleotide-binding domain protein [Bacilli bacterium]
MGIPWFDNTARVISFVLQLVFILVLCGCVGFTFLKVCRRKTALILVFSLMGGVLITFIFAYIYAFVALSSALILVSFFTFMSNIGDVRKFLANPFKTQKVEEVKTVQRITDIKSLFQEVQNAVVGLSDRKVGALITFEKNTNLNDICKNGVAVNAPFTKELIDTIFYPGTRLHDGAVIVKDGMISTASVFYTPTTKPFAVKYGSRHRAALGISEISDAVTIVVSEETGLVSIAYEGSIEHVEADRLANTLANYF